MLLLIILSVEELLYPLKTKWFSHMCERQVQLPYKQSQEDSPKAVAQVEFQGPEAVAPSGAHIPRAVAPSGAPGRMQRHHLQQPPKWSTAPANGR